jgi:hypothetical protein
MNIANLELNEKQMSILFEQELSKMIFERYQQNNKKLIEGRVREIKQTCRSAAKKIINNKNLNESEREVTREFLKPVGKFFGKIGNKLRAGWQQGMYGYNAKSPAIKAAFDKYYETGLTNPGKAHTELARALLAAGVENTNMTRFLRDAKRNLMMLRSQQDPEAPKTEPAAAPSPSPAPGGGGGDAGGGGGSGGGGGGGSGGGGRGGGRSPTAPPSGETSPTAPPSSSPSSTSPAAPTTPTAAPDASPTPGTTPPPDAAPGEPAPRTLTSRTPPSKTYGVTGFNDNQKKAAINVLMNTPGALTSARTKRDPTKDPRRLRPGAAPTPSAPVKELNINPAFKNKPGVNARQEAATIINALDMFLKNRGRGGNAMNEGVGSEMVANLVKDFLRQFASKLNTTPTRQLQDALTNILIKTFGAPGADGKINAPLQNKPAASKPSAPKPATSPTAKPPAGPAAPAPTAADAAPVAPPANTGSTAPTSEKPQKKLILSPQKAEQVRQTISQGVDAAQFSQAKDKEKIKLAIKAALNRSLDKLKYGGLSEAKQQTLNTFVAEAMNEAGYNNGGDISKAAKIANDIWQKLIAPDINKDTSGPLQEVIRRFLKERKII